VAPPLRLAPPLPEAARRGLRDGGSLADTLPEAVAAAGEAEAGADWLPPNGLAVG
jgi:hypothetical protein